MEGLEHCPHGRPTTLDLSWDESKSVSNAKSSEREPVMYATPLIEAIPADIIAELAADGFQHEIIGRRKWHRSEWFLIGNADLPLVSIVAGAHPDEPLTASNAISTAMETSSPAFSATLSRRATHGCRRQRGAKRMVSSWETAADLCRFLHHRMRRLPGADREFAWPGSPWNGCVLPECIAADQFLHAHGPAIAHLSMHGMSMAQGPWFLLNRVALEDHTLWQQLRASAADAQLPVHEFKRYGDKGFRRVGLALHHPKWASRGSSFKENDKQMADNFGYSMTPQPNARDAGHPEPLCGISEWPLLAIPSKHTTLLTPPAAFLKA